MQKIRSLVFIHNLHAYTHHYMALLRLILHMSYLGCVIRFILEILLNSNIEAARKIMSNEFQVYLNQWATDVFSISRHSPIINYVNSTLLRDSIW